MKNERIKSDMDENVNAYQLSQRAIADLKTAILMILRNSQKGIRNVDVGRMLGINHGHIRHEGHITRTLLELMKNDGVVKQNEETKKWTCV